MTAKKRPPKTKVSVAYCELFSTSPMRCPLCRILVPAKTPHACSKEQR